MNSWFFRPVRHLTPSTAGLLGLVAIGLTGIVATLGGLVTDGMLDLHFLSLSGLNEPSTGRWLLNWAQGLVNLFWASISLWIAAKLAGVTLSPWTLVAHLAYARWPIAFAATYLAIPGVGETILSLTLDMLAALPAGPDQVMASPRYLLPSMQLAALSIPLLLAVVWTIWLMYACFVDLTQLAQGKATGLFVVTIIIAELLSKLTVL